jgi:hypothetical protein
MLDSLSSILSENVAFAAGIVLLIVGYAHNQEKPTTPS